MDIETRLTNLEKLVDSLVKQMNRQKAYTDADIGGVRQGMSDVNQLISDNIFPEWDSNAYSYFAGEKVSYNGAYYRCIQSHTSQSDWTPEAAVSLWVAISDPGEEWPEWVQPAGYHDAYAAGDKVSHNDKHWISDVDANVWEPGVYGWTEN